MSDKYFAECTNSLRSLPTQRMLCLMSYVFSVHIVHVFWLSKRWRCLCRLQSSFGQSGPRLAAELAASPRQVAWPAAVSPCCAQPSHQPDLDRRWPGCWWRWRCSHQPPSGKNICKHGQIAFKPSLQAGGGGGRRSGKVGHHHSVYSGTECLEKKQLLHSSEGC